MNMPKSRDMQAKMPSPKVIYASNESKSVLARNLEECRDNDKNSQSVFLSFKCILALNCEGTEQLQFFLLFTAFLFRYFQMIDFYIIVRVFVEKYFPVFKSYTSIFHRQICRHLRPDLLNSIHCICRSIDHSHIVILRGNTCQNIPCRQRKFFYLVNSCRNSGDLGFSDDVFLLFFHFFL